MSSDTPEPTVRPTGGFIAVGVVIAIALGSIPLLRAERSLLSAEVKRLRVEQSVAAVATDSLMRVTATS